MENFSTEKEMINGTIPVGVNIHIRAEMREGKALAAVTDYIREQEALGRNPKEIPVEETEKILKNAYASPFTEEEEKILQKKIDTFFQLNK